MHLDPLMPQLVGAVLGILVLGMALRRLRQPHVVAYLLAGVLLGPFGLGLVEEERTLSRVGSIGVLLLLFFVGMEASPSRLTRRFGLATWALFLQVGLSLALVSAIGAWLEWSAVRVLFVAFVISLSSSGLVIRLLEDGRELSSSVGQSVLSVLLLQDVAVVPMMLALEVLGGKELSGVAPISMIAGGASLMGLLVWVVRRGSRRLRLVGALEDDHEMQVFAALALCLGLALATGLLGLSPALGAFAAGLLVSSATETQWIRRGLEPFQIVFVAFFFVSMGMLADLSFMREHWLVVLTVTVLVLVLNTGINGLVLRFCGFSWTEGLYAGALLSQIGEFSFVLATVAREAGILADYAHRLTVSVICASLMVSPFWIRTTSRLVGRRAADRSGSDRPAATTCAQPAAAGARVGSASSTDA